MKLLQNAACTVVLASTSLCAFATDAADLAVTGTIFPAQSCTPDFSAGGVIDLGAISGTELSSIRYLDLPGQQIDLFINCGAKTRVGFKLSSNRIGTLADSDNEGAKGFGLIKHTMSNTTPTFLQAYGTGLDLDAKDNKIGGVLMNIQDRASIVDGDTSVLLLEGSNGSYSVKSPNTSLRATEAVENYYTWGDYESGGYVPIAFSSLESTMDVYAFLNLRDELDLAQQIEINGSVTFELVYL